MAEIVDCGNTVHLQAEGRRGHERCVHALWVYGYRRLYEWKVVESLKRVKKAYVSGLSWSSAQKHSTGMDTNGFDSPLLAQDTKKLSV